MEAGSCLSFVDVEGAFGVDVVLGGGWGQH